MKTTLASTQVRLPPGETVRIGIVADTHSKPHEKTLQHLKKLAPAAVLHAGDIGDRAVLERLETVAPLYAVRGNIDERTHELPDTLILDFMQGDALVLRALLTHIAVSGVKLRSDVAVLAHKYKARLVICGHSHVPFLTQDKGLTVFNPGSVGPKRFHLPIVFGALELGPNAISLRHVDCLTGATWLPG